VSRVFASVAVRKGGDGKRGNGGGWMLWEVRDRTGDDETLLP